MDEENVINENKLPAITWEPIPADILFPSELNQHLKDEIKARNANLTLYFVLLSFFFY